MPIKVDADATDFTMGLNNNFQEPGEIKENKVHDDQHATAPAQIHFEPRSQDYH